MNNAAAELLRRKDLHTPGRSFARAASFMRHAAIAVGATLLLEGLPTLGFAQEVYIWDGPIVGDSEDQDWFRFSAVNGVGYSNWRLREPIPDPPPDEPPGADTARTIIDNGATAVIGGRFESDANAGDRLEISGGSRLLLEAGSLVAGSEMIGDSSDATVTQGAIWRPSPTHIVKGRLTVGSQGTYYLIDGTLTSGSVQVDGTFNTSAGGILRIGIDLSGDHRVDGRLAVGSRGTYNLAGGTLTSGSAQVDGTFNQQPGQYFEFDFPSEHSVDGQLTVGSQGTYSLTGSTLATGSVQVDGTFTQSVWGDSPFFGLAADHRVDGQLTVGSRGTYSLTGGSLTSEGVHVDGTFDQQGGDHSVDGLLTVRSQATYRLTGGSLTSEGVRVDGTFDQQGGDHSVEGLLTVGSQGTYSLSRGILTAGGIRNDGTLIFNPGEDSELSASISGTGELRKQGAATLELTGTNSFSGRTSVETGVLKGDTASLQGPTIVIGQGATLELDQQSDGVYGGSISGDGALRKDGDAALFLRGNNSYAGGTAILSGVLQGDTGSLQGNITNSGTVVFDQAATGIYAGTISGSGNLVKQGNGLLIFNGSSTHVGGTQIVDGNVQIGDASHPGASISGLVSIGLNGILSGQGTIYGDVDNVGTIAPGGSIGALRVAGDVAFHPGSRFQVAVSPDAASRLIVDGVASLGGAQVEAVATHGSYGPNRYEVLSAASIEGRFADALISSFEAIDPLLIPALGYGGGNVYLDLEPAPLSNPMGPGKEVVTDLIQMIDRLTTGRFPQALGALSPNDLGLWARGFGMVSSASAEGDEPGYEGDARGFLIGFDGQITDRLSLGIAGFSADVDVKTEVSYTDRSSVNVGGFNLYAAYTLDAWQVRSALGYTSERYSSRQSIGSGTQFRRARGSMDARRISGCTEGSWTFKSGSLSLQPTLGLQYGWLEQDDFTQRGLYADGQSLNVNSRSQYLFDTVVGGRVRYDAVISRNTEVQAEARAMYVHRFGELDDRMDGTSSNGTRVSLGTQDRPGDRDAAIVGAGITVLTADNLHLYAEYSGQFLSGRSSNAFSAGVRYVW